MKYYLTCTTAYFPVKIPPRINTLHFFGGAAKREIIIIIIIMTVIMK
jgi:hypothetical protein